ncbi:MFS transporter [Spirosoma koreense]
MEKPPPPSSRTSLRPLFALPVIVSALGYFVDIYDMVIFTIVRVPSLQALHLSKEEISTAGTFIFNCQQAGLLLGGFLWGVLGDRRGRMSVLFGSIVTYSLANIACGFVQDVNVYALFRFIAGVGLSGEIGAAMVLVSEILPKEIRGYGSSLIAGIGYLGAGAAYLTADFFDWRMAFWVGGGMGVLLLLLRVSVFESGLFNRLGVDHKAVRRGNFFYFFSSRAQRLKYFRCVAVGVPTWFVVSILAAFANELGEALTIDGGLNPGRCVMFIYVGFAIGDFLCGPLSQWLRSRLKAIIGMLVVSTLLSAAYLSGSIHTAAGIYIICLLAGISTGYIAMFLTMVAELYGTNLRNTATTSVPSVVRGTAIIMTLSYQALKPSIGVLATAAGLGFVVYGLAFWSLSRMEETFGKELDFVE